MDVDPSVYQSFLVRCGGNSFGPWDTLERQVGSLNTDAFVFRDVYISTNRNLRLPTTKGNFQELKETAVLKIGKQLATTLQKFESASLVHLDLRP